MIILLVIVYAYRFIYSLAIANDDPNMRRKRTILFK